VKYKIFSTTVCQSIDLLTHLQVYRRPARYCGLGLAQWVGDVGGVGGVNLHRGLQGLGQVGFGFGKGGGLVGHGPQAGDVAMTGLAQIQGQVLSEVGSLLSLGTQVNISHSGLGQVADVQLIMFDQSKGQLQDLALPGRG